MSPEVLHRYLIELMKELGTEDEFNLPVTHDLMKAMRVWINVHDKALFFK